MENENSNLIDQQLENVVAPELVLQNESKRKPFLKTFLGRLIKGILLIGLLFVTVLILPIILQQIAVPLAELKPGFLSDNDSAEYIESVEILEKSISKLDKQLKEFIPKSSYIIINSTDNEFILKKGDEIIRKGKCSTGSYLMLENDKQQKWLFKTPKGLLTVKSKRTDPVWTKPDWAFVEEGLPVPGPNHPSRIEEGVLGDYALSLGNGYMIHGTLWQRYLGLAVTHGCVRLNDADLEVVYNNLSKGSNVYIY
jgi:L,D-transpeptidase ErfK/SrfK